MVTTPPTIKLLPIIRLRKKRSLPVRILTSPKTTLALTAILGGLLFPAAGAAVARGVAKVLIPKTLPGVAKVAFAAGVLSVAPSLIRTFNPFSLGQKAAPFIEDPSRLLPDTEKDETLGEKIKDVAITAGLATAGVAALVGSIGLLAKKIKKLKPGAPGLPGLPGLPGAPGVPGVSLPATMAPVISQPLGPAKKPEPEKPKAPLPGALAQPINIKILNKPVIDIRFSKSRKFINQQLLIR